MRQRRAMRPPFSAGQAEYMAQDPSPSTGADWGQRGRFERVPNNQGNSNQGRGGYGYDAAQGSQAGPGRPREAARPRVENSPPRGAGGVTWDPPTTHADQD